MASATINLKVMPRRMLPIKEAAAYCGIPAQRFAHTCRIAPVVMPGGSKLYDMRDLDAWLDSLKEGSGSGDDEILDRLG